MKIGRFEQVVLPHMDAAYNLARWLCHDEHDAQDVVQESWLRSFRAFDSFHGEDARCWVLSIVRNTCYTWLTRNRKRGPAFVPDEQLHEMIDDDASDPQITLLRHADRTALKDAIEQLPEEYREMIVLRELEELSYKQIADVTALPIGTVMSRLSRARKRLEETLLAKQEVS